MLTIEDKQWITDTIDERLDIRLDERLGTFRDEMEELIDDKLLYINLTMENQVVPTLNLLKEYIPGAGESYAQLKEQCNELDNRTKSLTIAVNNLYKQNAAD